MVDRKEDDWGGICYPCKKIGISASGTVYCQNCKQIYCWNCSKLHKANQYGCQHTLSPYIGNIQQSPSRKDELEISTFKYDQFGNEEKNLQRVRNEYIKALSVDHDHTKTNYPDEVYCVKHKQVVCKTCKFRRHSLCTECLSVRKACQILVESGQYLAVISELKQCHTVSSLVLKETITEKELLTEKETVILKQIQDLKHAVIRQVSKLEKELLDHIYETHQNTFYSLNKAENILKIIKESSGEMLKSLKDDAKYGIEPSSFKTVMECQNKAVLFHHMLDRLYNHCNMDNLYECFYQSDHSVESIAHCFGSLGTLKIDKYLPQLPSILLSTNSEIERSGCQSTVFFGNYNASCDDLYLSAIMDKYSQIGKSVTRWSNPDFLKHGIVRIECLDKDDLLALDRTSCSILLIDRFGEPFASYSFECIPWGMTLYDDHTAAVTIPGENKIVFVSLEFKDFVLKREIKCSVEPSAITGFKGNIFVTSYPWSDMAAVYKLDDSGKIIGTLEVDDSDNRLFKAPLDIVLDQITEDIFVCDSGLKVIFAFNKILDLKFKIDLEYMGHPSSMTLDTKGNVFICGKLSNVIYKVTTAKQSGKIAFTENDGLGRPQAVCSIPGEETICVLCARDNSFKIFKIA